MQEQNSTLLEDNNNIESLKYMMRYAEYTTNYYYICKEYDT